MSEYDLVVRGGTIVDGTGRCMGVGEGDGHEEENGSLAGSRQGAGSVDGHAEMA